VTRTVRQTRRHIRGRDGRCSCAVEMMREHLSRYPVMRPRSWEGAHSGRRCDGGRLTSAAGRANRPAAIRRLIGGMGLGSAGGRRQCRLGYITTFCIFPSLSSLPSHQSMQPQRGCGIRIDCLEALAGRAPYVDKHNIPFATASYVLLLTSSSLSPVHVPLYI